MSSVTQLQRSFPVTFPLFSHHDTHHTQFPGSLPDFPLHLMQFHAQLLTWDQSRPFWGWWWGLWLAGQGVRLPLQQQPITNSLVHEAKHTHSSTRFTPRAERPGPIPDHSHKQLITQVFTMNTTQLRGPVSFFEYHSKRKIGDLNLVSSNLTLGISCS